MTTLKEGVPACSCLFYTRHIAWQSLFTMAKAESQERAERVAKLEPVHHSTCVLKQ